MDIITIIQTLGFPIACVVAMGWYVYDNNEKARTDRKEVEAQHKAEVSQLSEVIQNNTIALTKLVDKLGGCE